jgi:signal peptidase I
VTRRELVREVVLDAAAAMGALCLVVALAHALFGTTLLVFRSGSMAPAIDTGALALAVDRPLHDLERGDVVSVVDTDGVRVTHRVVEVTDQGLVLQGDANPSPDDHVYAVDHADVVLASVPHLGRALDRATHGWWLLLQGSLAAGAVVLVLRRKSPPAQGRRSRTAVLSGLVVALVVSGPLVRTWASWSDTADLTGSADANDWFSCSSAVGDLGPWLYWRFDETNANGTAADSSGNGRAGTYTGGVTARAAQACSRDTGTAVTLNGSTGYVYSNATAQPTATAGPNTFTVAIWFKTTTTRGGRLIGFGLSRTGASSQYDRHLYLTDAGKLVFGVYPGGFQSLTSTASYNDGGWHQAVGQVGPAGMKLFVDGDEIAANAAVTTAESYSGWWRVGYDNLGGWPNAPTSPFFAGTVDDAAVWTKALTAAQVLAAYRAGR